MHNATDRKKETHAEYDLIRMIFTAFITATCTFSAIHLFKDERYSVLKENEKLLVQKWSMLESKTPKKCLFAWKKDICRQSVDPSKDQAYK